MSHLVARAAPEEIQDPGILKMVMIGAVLPPRVTALATKNNRTSAPFNPSSHDYLCAAKTIVRKR
jgi:hypothetical protein